MRVVLDLLMNRSRRLALVGLVAVLSACDSGQSAAGGSAPADAAKTVSAPSGKPWATQVVATPQNGFAMGNPKAPVHLIEYASTTCPHCREFHEQSMDALKRDYIAKGLVRYEYRSFVLNPVDLAASVVARCFGAKRFFPLMNSFFEHQQEWFEPFTKLSQAEQQAVQQAAPDQQLKVYARLGKLDAFVRSRGVTAAQFDACLSKPELRTQLEAIQKHGTEVDKVSGTPSFVINGEPQEDLRTWAQIEPKLKALAH